MVEYNPQFCGMLTERFPGAQVVEGDAYDVRRMLAGSPASASPRSCRACRCSPVRRATASG